MSQIFEDFCVLSEETKSIFKQNIELLYVFNNKLNSSHLYTKSLEGSNVLIVTKDDKVFGFGENCLGQLGFQHNKPVLEPYVIHELCNKEIINFANSFSHCLALTYSGKVFSWGYNKSGYLGFGNKSKYSSPKLIENLKHVKVIQICCGFNHSLALTNCSEIYGWGCNKFGQLGNGSNEDQLIPIKIIIDRLEKIKIISSGIYHSMALTESGHVFSWGLNDRGQLGTVNKAIKVILTPKRIEFVDTTIVSIKKISCGRFHSLLLTQTGDIYSFGDNTFGQLGYNQRNNQILPKKIENKFLDIAAHYYLNISIALSINEFYYNWGKCGEEVITEPIKTYLKSFQEIFTKYHKITVKPIGFRENDLIPILRFRKYENEINEIDYISHGSHGIVYKVFDKNDGIEFALKKIPLNQNEINRVDKEVEIMRKLKSDYVVEYKTSWIEKNYYNVDDYKNVCKSNNPDIYNHKVFHRNNTYLLHIQMELCLKDLKEVIIQLNDKLGVEDSTIMSPISFYIKIEILNEILKGVDYLHKQNIIHRDLHPQNILITNGLNGRFVKIADFGLAVMHKTQDQSHTEDRGHIRYAAPEVLRTSKYSMKADIYSLGVIIDDLLEFEKIENTIDNYLIGLKLTKLLELKNKMLSANSEEISFRPDCEEILRDKCFWSLGLLELRDNIEFKLILSDECESDSIDDNFYKLFVKTKNKNFITCLNNVKRNNNKIVY